MCNLLISPVLPSLSHYVTFRQMKSWIIWSILLRYTTCFVMLCFVLLNLLCFVVFCYILLSFDLLFCCVVACCVVFWFAMFCGVLLCFILCFIIVVVCCVLICYVLLCFVMFWLVVFCWLYANSCLYHIIHSVCFLLRGNTERKTTHGLCRQSNCEFYRCRWLGCNNYYRLNSLSLFWLAESVQWIFEISACDVI